MAETRTVYLVTVDDYEDCTIIGAYSTEAAAREAAAETEVVRYGRFGPYVFAVEVDPTEPSPTSASGTPTRGDS